MKELSVEEKAQRYDEAIKRIENIKTGKCETTFMFTEGLFEHIFPELAESEDEKIRKYLIKCVNENMFVKSYDDGFDKHKVLAWLEKQGENNMGISEATKQKLEDNLNKALEKETPESWNEFLEGQGEQKTTDKVEPKFKVKYAGSEYNVLEVKDIAGITFYGIEDEPNHIDYVRPDHCEIIRGYGWFPNPTNPADKCEGCNNAKGCVACVDGSEWAHIEEHNPAWSEEDERMFDIIISDLERHGGKEGSCYSAEINWLKSLKDRVQPQPKQEWSEEEEEVLLKLTSFIEDWDKIAKGKKSIQECTLWSSDEHLAERLLNFLNSLRPQNKWKPSDEQMATFWDAICNLSQDGYKWINDMKSIYQDLKKLMEE